METFERYDTYQASQKTVHLLISSIQIPSSTPYFVTVIYRVYYARYGFAVRMTAGAWRVGFI